MSDMIQADSSQLNSAQSQPALAPLFQNDDDITTLAPPPVRRRRRRGILIVSIVVLLALIGSGAFVFVRRAQSSRVQYTTSTVNVGNLTQTVSASGPIKAKAEYDLNFTTSGQISQINVHVGDQVKAGWVLAKLNSPTLQDAVAQAQQNVNNAQTVYNDAVNNGASQTTLDNDNNSLQSALVQLKTAQDNLAAATLIAPGHGVIAAINGTVGQTAGSGSSSSSSTSQAFIVLLDTSGFTINAQVNEADIASVQVGQPVSFTVTAYPSQVFRAVVSSINTIGVTSSSLVTYTVNLAVDMNSLNNLHLYPGMTATANITTAQRLDALLVSNQALSFPTTALRAGIISRSDLVSTAGGSTFGGRGSGQGNQRVVLELKNGKLTPVMITIGLTNGAVTEVLSGLQSGDSVVVGATGGPFANLSTNTGTGGAGGAGNGNRTRSIFGGGG